MEKTRDGEVKFTALTQGLGFHPFSDGLPYAPVTKTQVTPAHPRPKAGNIASGTGAVAAGPPSFARVSVPIAPPAAVVPTITPVKPQPTIALPENPVIAAASKYGFFYLLKRTLAYVLDSFINVTLCIGALGFVLWKQQIQSDLLITPSVILLLGLFLVGFNWALVTAQEVAFGTSIGKRLFGLVLRGSVSAIFLRAFFFLPSVGFSGVGLIWSIFNRRRRCWHDSVVDLQPEEVSRL